MTFARFTLTEHLDKNNKKKINVLYSSDSHPVIYLLTGYVKFCLQI